MNEDTFSKNLKQIMQEKHVTQSDIANELHLSKSTVNSWVNGFRMPRMDKIALLADFLGVKKSDFFDDMDNIEYYSNPETREIAQEIYENKELSLLFDAARNADPEDLEMVHNMLLALKRKEQKNDN